MVAHRDGAAHVGGEQLICPRTNAPIFRLNQDSLLGCYLLSQPECVLTHAQAEAVARQMRVLEPNDGQAPAFAPLVFQQHLLQQRYVSPAATFISAHYRATPRRAARLPADDYRGTQLLALALPSQFYYAHHGVVIQAGKWVRGAGSKAVFVGERSISHMLWRDFGKQYAVDAHAEFAIMGCHYLEHVRGFTCGLADVTLGGRSAEEANNNAAPLQARLDVYDKVEAAYSALGAELAKSEVQGALTAQDVSVLYGRLQQQCEPLVGYLGNLNQLVSAVKQNHAMLMAPQTGAGSKGSEANISAMASTLGYRRSAGKTLGWGMTASKRRHTSSAYGEMSAATMGLFKNPFAVGLSDAEVFASQQIERPGIYDSADLDLPGYQQKGYNKMAESEAVCYDGTVRNGVHEIVQLAYGGDACHPKYMLHVTLSPAVVSVHARDTSALELKRCALARALVRAVTGRLYYGNKTAADVQRDGWRCLVSVDVATLLIYARELGKGDGAVVSEMQARDAVLTLVHTLEREELARRVTLLDLKLHVLDVVTPEAVVGARLSEKWLRALVDIVHHSYIEHLAEPGDAVGISASQNLSEPASQIKLRAFNMVVTTESAANMLAYGLSQQKENWNGTAKSEVNMLARAPLSSAWADTADKADAVRAQLVSVVFGEVVEAVHCLWLATTAEVKHTVAHTLPSGQITEAHVLTTAVRAAIVASYRVRAARKRVPTHHPFLMFRLNEAACDKLYGATSRLLGHGSSLRYVETLLECGLLPWQRAFVVGGPAIHAACPYYYCLWFQYADFDVTDGWLARGADGAAWLAHTASLLEAGRTLLKAWRISGEDGMDACLSVTPAKAGADEAIVDDEDCLETPAGDAVPCHLLSRMCACAAAARFQASTDTLWVARAWPQVQKQFGMQGAQFAAAPLPCLDAPCQQAFVERLLLHEGVPSMSAATKHTILLAASSVQTVAWLGAVLVCQGAATLFEGATLIALLKPNAVLLQERYVKSASDASNHGIQVVRTIAALAELLGVARLVLVNSEGYTDQMYRTYEAECGRGGGESSLLPHAEYAHTREVELWRADEFLFDWWRNKMVPPFRVYACTDAACAGVADILGRPITRHKTALPRQAANSIAARRLRLRHDAHLLVSQRFAPKPNTLYARVVQSVSRRDMQ